MPIRPGGVKVQVAFQVARLNQVGQVVLQRRLDLAPVLAQFRRDERQTQRGVDLLLGGAEDFGAVLALEGILTQREPLIERQYSQVNVVGLTAGKVLERRAPTGRLQHAQVHLQSLVGADRGLGGAAEQYLGHLGEFAEAGHHRLGVSGRHQQIQVAHSLPHTAHTAGRGGPHHARRLL